jgi:LysM repeat protein
MRSESNSPRPGSMSAPRNGGNFPLAAKHMRRKAAAVGLSAAVATGAFAGPASAATSYTVRPGDTLTSIAKKFDAPSWRTVFRANPGIDNPDLIFVGQKLYVPGHGDASAPAKQTKISAAKKAASAKAVAKKTTVKRSAKKASAKKSTVRRASTATRSVSSAGSNGVWDRLAMCESTGNWSINTGNGFYGGLQFTLSSWRAVGGKGMPHHASKAEQIARAKKLQAIQGWGAWPACSKKLGLR